MSSVHEVMDRYLLLYGSEENSRRLAQWTRVPEGVRWENQWHGLPAFDTSSGRCMPVTAECLDAIWESLIGLDQRSYYQDPAYYLEYYLRMKIEKFLRLPDDTPLTLDIPLVFGVTHEAGLLGQTIHLDSGGEPSFSHQGIVDEHTQFPDCAPFRETPYFLHLISFYTALKNIAGEYFHVIFPQWYRGPQGTALYVRGFENFCLDLYLNEDFVHRLLRYITNTAREFSRWRSGYTGEPIGRGDLFNDDIPLISPQMYEKFILPYEQEMSEFFGGIYYWHSCGDVAPYISLIQQLPDIDLIDFGVSMEDKETGLKALTRDIPVEFRVMAQKHIQQCSREESRAYVARILALCRKYTVARYVIRSSGMSVVHGAERDLKMLAQWVEMVREVQEEGG